MPASAAPTETHERRQSLWWLVASPVIWAGHFLLCYVTVAIWCEKVAGRDGALGSVRTTLVLYTAVALAGIALVGWRGYRRHRHGDARTPHHADTPEDRHRFLGFATLLLSGLSAIAVAYTALTIVFISTCH